MNIDQLIDELAALRKRLGNLPICTFEGRVSRIEYTTCEQGIKCRAKDATEVVLDVQVDPYK